MTGFEPAASQGYNLGDNATSRNRLNHSELAEASESSRVPEKKPSRWPLEGGHHGTANSSATFSDQVAELIGERYLPSDDLSTRAGDRAGERFTAAGLGRVAISRHHPKWYAESRTPMKVPS